MSLITYEGFENYSSFSLVKSFLNYADFNTSHANGISILTALDSNSVSPRNNGACLRLVSSSVTYPRIGITHPSNASHTAGVFGFAWYNFLPAGRTTATHYATFVPIATLFDDSARPHFFVGINSLGQIEVRRRDTSNQNGAWNASLAFGCGSCGKGGCSATCYSYFDSSYYTLLAASSSLVTENAWNYIEVKYTISTTGFGGSIQIKLNRNSNDNTIDLTTTAQNTAQPSINVRGICLGLFRGAQSAFTNGGTNSATYTVYYDDIYWCDQTGDTYNNFLGRVSCTKFNYNTVATNTFADPVNSGVALSNVNEIYGGAGALTTRNTANAIGQALDLRASGVANETLPPIFVRQYVHGYKTEVNSDIGIGATDGVNSIADSGVSLTNDSINGVLRFRNYDNAPDATEWTNQKIANTTFRHTGI